ncbi:hypothetical protein [Paraburkholderia caribensis]|uniref:hypothetical protein n=1 Tax=Paraburkholderia caribensis TaxID=75105 RepID=UPI001590A295|nr:hypothetical protein [Paraburkholderia caribensis]
MPGSQNLRWRPTLGSDGFSRSWMGDEGKNIGEFVVFVVKGRDIRHIAHGEPECEALADWPMFTTGEHWPLSCQSATV